MREIKFRAWHKRYKKMYEVSDLHMATIMNEGIWATVNGRNPIEDKDIKIQIQPNQIEIMQYIGLKDKNGIEIYEGDIVAGASRIQEDWRLLQKVHYLSGCFMFGNWNTHEYFNKHIEIEVVGNVYKNPELLEEK